MSTEKAEQVETPAQAAPAAQQQAPAIPDLGLGSFIKEETRQALDNLGKNIPAEQQQAAAPEKKETPAAKDKKEEEVPAQQPTAEEGKPAPEKKEEKQEPKKEVPKSIFGLNKKKDAVKDVAIENIDQAFEVIKTKFGQEIKDVKDLPKFFESAQKWRADSQKVEDLSSKLDQVAEEISALPEDIMESIKLFQAGQEYATPFVSKPKFDFKKAADKQDIKALVNHYHPGKFTDEDFTGDPSPLLDLAISTAKDKYTIEKQLRESKGAEEVKKAESFQKAFRTSVSGSLENLKQSFPDVEDDNIKDVKSILEGGPAGLVNHFFNKDGTVKADTAKRLMFAIHGEDEIKKLMEFAANQAESKVNEEIVTRSADGPKPKKSSGSVEVPEEIKKQIDELSQFKRRNTY